MERLQPLTSLRFFFALAVFGHHCFFITEGDYGPGPWLYANFLAEGYLGVTFFFILSGFILTHAYADRLGAGRISRGRFYLGRWGRIYPLHLLALLVVLPLSLGQLTAEGGWLRAAAHLTLTQTYWLDPDIYRGFNMPAWSISVELVFYALFPFLLTALDAAFRRFGNGAFAVAAVVMLVPVVMAFTPESLHHALFYVHPVPRLAEFLLGMLLYRLFVLWRGRGCRGRTLWEAGAVGCLLLWVVGYPLVPDVYRYSVYYWPPMLVVIGVFALRGGKLSHWLSHPRWVYLGEISFAFYLLHRPIMGYYEAFKTKVWAFDNYYVDVLALLCATLVASHLCYRYFERPVYRWIRSL
ncbi:MAG: acyltransferase [Bacteroidota bacterium]